MKLINYKLKNKIWNNVQELCLEHALFHSPVRDQIKKDLGLWDGDDSLFRLKIYDSKLNIRNDLDETT